MNDSISQTAAPGSTAAMRQQMRSRPQERPQPLFPQLKARKNASREEVRAHQRARLRAAMIEAVARKGYAATTARDVVWLAGVSTKTLYSHFVDKEDCFLSTFDFVVEEAMTRISAAYRIGSANDGNWLEGLSRAFEAFVAELVEHPKRARLALVEVLAAGPAALERIERGEALFARMITQSLARAPDGVVLPPLLVRSLVSGIWFVSRGRLLENRSATISDFDCELLEWMLSYRSPAAVSLACKEAKGCQSQGRPLAIRCNKGDDRTRMLRCAAQVAAKVGYLGMTPGQIAELADVSPKAFAREFDSVTECFLASLELLTAEALALALHESEGAPSWPSAVCRAIRALLCQIAEDRVFAQAVFVEAYAAGPVGIERRSALLRSFAALLVRRAPRRRRPSPFVAEAIVGAVWSIAHRHVLRGQARSLPALSGHAAYVVLTPIIGAEKAVEAILTEFVEGGEGGESSEARSSARRRATAAA